MKRFLNRVTVTGADDTINPRELAIISQEYPATEFGLLLSEKLEGQARYPSYNWLLELSNINGGFSDYISYHLCGSFVRDILEGRKNKHLDRILPLRHFSRIQLNTHGEEHDYSITALWDFINRCGRCSCTVILQNDGSNEQCLADALDSPYGNIAVLNDLSSGAGKLPDEWPKPHYKLFTGYAGGLTPDNLETELVKLEELTGGRNIWIDSETGLRSDKDNSFDLNKVRKFANIAHARI